jgi:hypothetical protein
VTYGGRTDDADPVMAGAAFAEEFFMTTSKVHRALAKLTQLLDEAAIPYAVVGAMALNEHGYRRVTEDVDVLLTPDGLAAFQAAWLGRGYVARTPGSRGMRDTENDVAIDVLLSGEFPGDGKPKSVSFPDPSIATSGTRVRVLPLAALLELKLASGISAPHRLRDLADVLEVIRVRKLPRDFRDGLDRSVRAKFDELWIAAQGQDPTT